MKQDLDVKVNWMALLTVYFSLLHQLFPSFAAVST